MSAKEKEAIQKNKIEGIPDSIYYFPNFISKQEEEFLLKNVHSAPKPKWTHLSNRRLQNWGGLPHPKGMIPEEIPKWLLQYIEKIQQLGVFEDKKLNHVLVNEYEAGQGIMPHKDGPLYYPIVSTISLGSHTLLDFYHPLNKELEADDSYEQPSASSLEERHFTSVMLEPRSLVLVCDEMYKTYLHGIAERSEDQVTDKVANIQSCTDVHIGDRMKRSTRVSLTIRHVPKVLKTKMFLSKS